MNEAIRSTLRTPGPEEFWWLNNGITVVAEKVGGHPKELVLEEPQVVNGLQTSKEIFDFFQFNPAARNGDEREVMVRIIGSTDVDVQDHIIRATNSQTSIPIASLWATETIHRDIERIFRSNGLHYDRRKNSWRMKGVPLSKVVGITELAQAVAAICLQEPDHARARPARYFQKEEIYEKVFTTKYPIDLYVVCASIRKKAESFLRRNESDKRHRNNLLFYLMMVAPCLKLRTPRARPSTMAGLDVSSMDDSIFQSALDFVRPVYASLGSDDQASKGPEMISAIKKELTTKFRPKRKGKDHS